MFWLSLVVMLYGGIVGAAESYGIDNKTFAWNVIKALLFECGVIPGMIVMWLGLFVMAQDERRL